MNHEEEPQEITKAEVAKAILNHEYQDIVEGRNIKVVELAKRHRLAIQHDAWLMARNIRYIYKTVTSDSESAFRRNLKAHPEYIQRHVMAIYKGQNEEAFEKAVMEDACRQACGEFDE